MLSFFCCIISVFVVSYWSKLVILVYFIISCIFCVVNKSFKIKKAWHTLIFPFTSSFYLLLYIIDYFKYLKWKLKPFLFCLFFIFLFLIILRASTEDGLESLARIKVAFTTLSTAVYIGNGEVFRRSGKIKENTVTLNALYNVNILWPKNVFP